MDSDTIAHVCHSVMVHLAEKAATTKDAIPNATKKQFGIKAGLKRFGPKGEDALMKELCQFHLLQCFTPLDASKLSRDDHHNALSTILFLTEKSNGDIKACGCTDG
jgi:hypothetical protein